MSRGQQTFKQSDLTKALKAMVKAGIVGRVEIDKNGKIVIVTARPEDAANGVCQAARGRAAGPSFVGGLTRSPRATASTLSGSDSAVSSGSLSDLARWTLAQSDTGGLRR